MRASPTTWIAIGAASTVLFAAPAAHAWLFEEHANIGRFAVVNLAADDVATFDVLWAAARSSSPGAATWLCDNGRASPTHDRRWTCVDFGALPATAGDHSCTPKEMWATVTDKPWFRDVYARATLTEQELHATHVSDAKKVDAWHQGNIDLQRIDPDYTDRAKRNNVHFVLAREWDEDTVAKFMERSSRAGTAANATHAYAMYHLAALAAAARLAKLQPTTREYAEGAVAVLETEAFALHFLQDAFAAGHFVGLLDDPGSIAERPGTHDYYCEHGLEGRTWGTGISYGAHGDGFQTDPCLVQPRAKKGAPAAAADEHGVVLCQPSTPKTDEGEARSDLVMTGAAVRASLMQVLRVVRGEALDATFDPDGDRFAADNVCEMTNVTKVEAESVQIGAAVAAEVLALTPMPYRSDPELPHFRSEIGVFLGGSAAARAAAAFGGERDPSGTADWPRFQSAISVGLGGGVGIEGVTTQSTDGVFAAEFDVISYGAEQFACQACAVPPTRFGWGVRVHLPFYVLPGDALVSIPLYLAGHDTMAIEAAQGSLSRLERVHASSGFAWQIVLAREAAFYSSRAGAFQMSELELPLLEFRSKHEYSERLGGDVAVQLGGTIEWDTLDDGTAEKVHTHAGSVFVRLSLDGIHYLWP